LSLRSRSTPAALGAGAGRASDAEAPDKDAEGATTARLSAASAQAVERTIAISCEAVVPIL
jgi:hypothetical protein